jgi:hypothetical protein
VEAGAVAIAREDTADPARAADVLGDHGLAPAVRVRQRLIDEGIRDGLRRHIHSSVVHRPAAV